MSESRRGHDPAFHLGRRTFLYGSAAVAAGTVLGGASSPAVASLQPARGLQIQLNAENLGVPMRSVNIRAGAVGTLDGGPVFYVHSNGKPGVFNVIDVKTGRRLAAHEVEGFENSYAIEVAPDGSVYFEARPGGHLCRYLPAEDRLIDLGKVTRGASATPGLVIDENGVVYGGTTPDAHLFSYDPRSEEFTDFGLILEGEKFCRVGAVGDGVVYAGTSHAGRLFAVDAQTGTKTEIQLPDAYASTATRALSVAYEQGLLFIFVSTSRACLVYDTRTGEWIGDLPSYGADAKVSNRVGAKVYGEDLDTGNLWEYDLVTREASITDFNNKLGGTTRAMGIASLAERDFPGISLAGMGLTGRMWHWNPFTGAARWLDADVQGTPVRIRRTAAGPDGNIYIGGFFTSGVMARYLTAEDRLEQLAGPTQIEGFGVHDGKLYFGTYTGAGVMQYDPEQPWDFGSNPRMLFSLGDRGQERPWALTGVGDRVAIGTVAAKGSLDGALTFYAPATDEVTYIGTLFDSLGVTSLAAHGLLLAGGTSTNVSATPPVAEVARLFLWDAANDELLWDGVPFEDVRTYGDLVFDDDSGRLWGIANNDARVFEFDVETRQVVRSVSVQPGSRASGGIPELFFGQDGALYGTTGETQYGTLFRVDPEALDVEILDTPHAASASLGPDGQIYYSKNEIALHRLAV